MLSVFPSGFPHQVHNIRIEKQMNIQFRSSPLWSKKFYDPTASEPQIYKTGIKKLATHSNQTGIFVHEIS